MDIEIKLGKRTYIFYSEADVEVAENVYAAHISNNRFEDMLDILRIDFSYAAQED